MDKNQRIINLIGGPIVSLVMIIVLSILIPVVSNRDVQTLFSTAATFCAVSFLITAIPIKYPQWMGSYYGQPSDIDPFKRKVLIDVHILVLYLFLIRLLILHVFIYV